ncbi:hypothetical protein [Actinoplanes sp. NPDC089786]|uniref:hypothetical protein n=1 Tax=Actinoplanes sp. NPDC089786 TaxID=3155185 RepID=UPI00344546E5
MTRVKGAATAASSQASGPDGGRVPAGEVHAWLPGTNQTVCGLALSRTRLLRFPHVPFDFRATDVLTAEDEIGYLCPRCVAAATPRDARRWKRESPRRPR